MSNNRIRLYATSAMTAATLSILPMQAANAAPAGGNVVGGTATISVDGLATNINQSTSRAAINWTSFDVGSKESVTFNVPNNGATLNRVTGNVSTTIQGTVTSNGTLYLVNPNGIVLETGSHVTAQNFVATTSNIDPASFMSGSKFTTDRAATNARIDLKGTITVADRGIVGIFSPQVSNSGTINANLGQVTLGGVQSTIIDFTGDGLMNFEVGTSQSRTDGRNIKEVIRVENHGTISSSGGTVTLTAQGATDLLNAMIVGDGNIDVTSLTAQGGNVAIQAVNGSVTETGKIDASGAMGGGNVKLWATENAYYNGDIKSEALTNRQGAYDGGFVEVSGLKKLGFKGTVSTLSLSGGNRGNLLLDPTNIVVDSGYEGSLVWNQNIRAQVVTSNATDYTISASTIVAALASTNVKLEATNSITVNAEINWERNSDGTLNNTASILTLSAGKGGVTVNKSITSSAGGGLVINTVTTTGSDGNGDVNLNADISVNSMSINSGGGITGKNDIKYGDAILNLKAYNDIKISGNISSGDYLNPTQLLTPGNANITSTTGSVSISSINLLKFALLSDKSNGNAQYYLGSFVGQVTINAANGSVDVSGGFAGLSGSSKLGWTALLSSDVTIGGITNGDSGGIKIVTSGDMTTSALINNGYGGILLNAEGNVKLNGNLMGGKGDVIIATTGTDKSVTLGASITVNSAVGKSLYVLTGSGGFVAGTNTLKANTGNGTAMDMYYYGGTIKTTGATKAVNLNGGKFTNEFIGVSAVGEVYNLETKFYNYDLDLTTVGQKISAASISKVNGLIVAGGGSISIADISAPAVNDSNYVYAADLNYITANGITVSGTNIFSGDLKLVSYGNVGATVTDDPSRAGISFRSRSSLNVIGSLVLENQANISTSGLTGSAFGIVIDNSSVTVGKDLTIIQNGTISAKSQSGSAYGIDIYGGSSGLTTLTAGNDINFTQTGKLSSDGSSAFGIAIDGSINSSVAISAKGGNISMTQSGAIIGNGSVYGVFLNGYRANATDKGSVSLSAFGNVTLTQTSDITTDSNLSAGLGIYLYNSSVRAINGDITLNQNTGKVTDYRGGAYGIYILGNGSKTTNGKTGGETYSLYAAKDILLTQDGEILSDGNQNYAAGITMDGAKIFAGHNIVGLQAGKVTQNYNATDSGYQIMNSDLRAGYTPTVTAVKKSGNITLQQSGDINRTNDVTNSSNSEYPYRDQGNVKGGVSNSALIPVNATNPGNAASIYDPTKHSAPFIITERPARGFFIENSKFTATNDVSIIQNGMIGANPNSQNGIIIAASSSAGTSFDAGESVNLTSGTNGTNGNGVYLYSSSPSNNNSRIAGKFTVKGKVFHIDLSGGEFNAGNQRIDATKVGNLVVTLPYGVDDNESADGSTNTAYIKGGKGGIAIDLGYGKFTRVTTTQDTDAKGVLFNKNVPGLNNLSNVSVDGNFATSGSAPTLRLDKYIPANIRALDDNDEQRTIADFTGIKAMGVVTINGTANGDLTNDAQNLAWIEGTSVKVTGNTIFNNSVTIVASGKFANIQPASPASAATNTKAAVPAVTGIYAGITIDANLAVSQSSSEDQVNNLTLIQNASNMPDRKTGTYLSGYVADNNAYGVYVTSKGSLGTSGNPDTITIIQNGDITAKGAGNARGLYIAGSIYQDGATAYSNGKIKADATGTASIFESKNFISLNLK